MIDKNKIEEIINNALAAEDLLSELNGRDIFLVEVNISTSNSITVFLDSPKGVVIEECILVSKYVDSKLDREEEDFELLVSSAGLDMPLKLKKQYIKNIGRKIEVILTNGQKNTYILKSVLDDAIEVSEEKKVKVENAKRKKMVELISTLPFTDIKITKVVPDFS